MFTRLLALGIALGLASYAARLSAAAVIGQAAPSWQLHNLNGDPVRLEDFAGQVVLLNFFRTTCVPCLWEIPDLTELQQQYASQGLVVIGIAAQESGDILEPFVEQQDIDYTVCASVESVLWDYHVFPLGGIPLTALIDRAGVLADWYRYYQTQEFHEAKLLPLLAAGRRPALAIGLDEQGLELSWPSDATDFILETRPTLGSGPDWTLVEEEVEQAGGRFRVVLPGGGQSAFYRLRKP